MQYNIHPILVHFPVAFLFIFSILSILPLDKWISSFSWKQIRFIVLIVGVAGAILAEATGDTAEQIIHPDHNLVEMHSSFAGISIFIYSALLLGQILFFSHNFINRFCSNKKTILKILNFLEKILNNNFIVFTLSFLGLISISITGLLGGVIAYGATADPLAPFVLKILGL